MRTKGTKALILSSGGIDSTTCLAIAIKTHGKENVATLSIVYGQKHFVEIDGAREIAEHYNVPHYELDLSGVYQYASNPLLANSEEEIPLKSYKDQIKENGRGRVSTYIPFRNGMFLSVAAAFAESIYPGEVCSIYYGAHRDDAAGDAYADCSEEFSNHMNQAITLGTYGKKRVISPLIELTKQQVVEMGLFLQAPYHLTWSCYNGFSEACGECATCLDRKEAFKLNGVEDPIRYKK